MPFGVIAVVLMLALRFVAAKRGQRVGFFRGNLHLRRGLWTFVAVFWGLVVFGACMMEATGVVLAFRGEARVIEVVITGVVTAVLVALGLAFFFSSHWVRRIAARRSYKAAYYAAHWSLTLPHTAEPYGCACYFAYLSLALRPAPPTRAELDWIGTRLDKEKRALGLFGAAFGLSLALEARLAETNGEAEAARELRERARVVFGTVTYLSWAACPRQVRKLANEYLTLDAARRGEWGAVEAVTEKDATVVTIAVRKWVRERLSSGEEPASRLAKKAITSPIWARLAARASDADAKTRAESDVMLARTAAAYASIVNDAETSPRTVLNLLVGLDRFVDTRSPDCVLPSEVRFDEEAAGAVADELADAIAPALARRGAPIFALPAHGAVSARVYRTLETRLTAELTAATKSGRERAERFLRGTPRDEWMEVSRIRGLFRRLEYTLGTAAAGAHAQQMFYEYGKLGVLLSESIPRRRPLAHAVFSCLRGEAARFGAKDAEARETRNMRITSGID